MSLRYRKPAGARRIEARLLTAAAAVLVFAVLVAPDGIAGLTPAGFARIPLEAVLGLALLLALPARARAPVATFAGAVLGLVTVLKVVDVGFSAVLGRPFDPVLDGALLGAGVDFLAGAAGRVTATVAVIAAAAVAAVVLVLVTLSVRRLTGVAERHRTAAVRAVGVLAGAWVTCALLGAQIVPGVPVAAAGTAAVVRDHALQVRAGLLDRQAFAAEVGVDAFRDRPAGDMLTGLRGKDVVVTFVESYGRDAVEDPELASEVGPVLDSGTQRLAEAGFAARSAFLTSPTAGGSSWLAHATFLSGLWIDNPQRYRDLVASDRLTLSDAFRRAGWQTVAFMPGTTQAWSEAGFYGYDRVYDFPSLGYHGPDLGWATVPDQYTLSAFERLERARPDRGPLMAEIALVSSHAPWAAVPRLVGWDDVGDGSVFGALLTGRQARDTILTQDAGVIRAEYRRAVAYSLNSLVSYVETYGDDDLVLVFLGDHQPAPILTGDGASHDVPVTVVARDPAVLEQISGWGWQEGLRPGPQAPVWRMDTFRDRFLSAFGP